MIHSTSGFRILPKNNSVKNVNEIKGIKSIFLNFFNQSTKESPFLINNAIKAKSKVINSKKLPIKTNTDNQKLKKSEYIHQYTKENNEQKMHYKTQSMGKRHQSSTGNMTSYTNNNKTSYTNNPSIQTFNNEIYSNNCGNYFLAKTQNKANTNFKQLMDNKERINSLSLEDIKNEKNNIKKLKLELDNIKNTITNTHKKTSSSISRPLQIINNNYNTNRYHNYRQINYLETLRTNNNINQQSIAKTNGNIIRNNGIAKVKIRGKVQKTFSYTQNLNNILNKKNISSFIKTKRTTRGKTNTQRCKNQSHLSLFDSRQSASDYFSSRCFSLKNMRSSSLSITSSPQYQIYKTKKVIKNKNDIKINKNTNYNRKEFKGNFTSVNDMEQAINNLKNRVRNIFNDYYKLAVDNVKKI